MLQNYDEALRRLLEHEGGYSNHPSDPGGPTNWGITIIDARKYWKRDATAADVKAMPLAVAKRIYKQKYWDAMRCTELPAGVDYAIFDYGVNSGNSRAIKVLERILGLPPDGRPDDKLVAAAAEYDERELVAAICDERLRFLKGLKTWPVFGRGWGKRVSDVRAIGWRMAGEAATAPSVPPPPVLQFETAEPPPPAETAGKAIDPAEQKTIGKSKTVWSVVIGIATTIAGTIMQAVSDNPATVAVLCGAIITALFLFVGRERIRKIIDQGV